MIELFLIGIGAGNPRHLTLQAIAAMAALDLVLIPRKGVEKDDLAALRRAICAEHLPEGVRVVEFDLPRRDAGDPDYRHGVDAWHDAIAAVWAREMARELPAGGRVGFLVWGDPALYDSTLRIAGRLGRARPVTTRVIPGITAIAALTSGHAIPLNTIGAPFTVTTGRRLREGGWPAGAETLVVMLDGECAFRSLAPEGVSIWWSAYAGMAEEIRLSGPLAAVGAEIVAARAAARARHGWIMDIYLLRREGD
ncbi:MAG: precorrin-6A synthase (deacetylating) [Paenirhodobacter sp.]|uniref:precorrin-6A synthase (deacetylating) n=1 Tax=Paenirhodobacter sp. TaxID=1965326 RepID=UPI003D0C1846